MKAKQLANMYTKQYVKEVFEKRLREEGFTCADDKYLCWYRVVNREVVNSIIFWAPRQGVPVWLEIGYGIFPLFSVLPYTQSVCFFNRPIDMERFGYQPIVGSEKKGGYTMIIPKIYRSTYRLREKQASIPLTRSCFLL